MELGKSRAAGTFWGEPFSDGKREKDTTAYYTQKPCPNIRFVHVANRLTSNLSGENTQTERKREDSIGF